MLLGVVLSTVLVSVSSQGTVKEARPLVFPFPFELPNRNDRAEQCWLRVEDLELTETLAIYCYIANGFLQNHIRDYNTRKMTEDSVDVSLWIERPRSQDDLAYNSIPADHNSNNKDWKATTVLDPITRMRLYVSKNAICRIIMYSREATTNYQVDCEMFLYYMNDRLTGSARSISAQHLLTTICIFLSYLNSDWLAS